MHHQKNIIFDTAKLPAFLAIALLVFFLAACAGSSQSEPSPDAVTFRQTEEQKLQMLEETFATMQQKIEQGVPPETLLLFITDSSRYWLDTLETYAREMPGEQVAERPFCEILAILAYHINDYKRAWDPDMNEDYRMLSLVVGNQGMIRRMTGLKLGAWEIKKDRGSVGLASSPKVPVVIFKWDDSAWKMDVKATLPLVTKGLESIGVKKNWTNKELALYLLEKEFHYKYTDVTFDDSLLNPVGAF